MVLWSDIFKWQCLDNFHGMCQPCFCPRELAFMSGLLSVAGTRAPGGTDILPQPRGVEECHVRSRSPYLSGYLVELMCLVTFVKDIFRCCCCSRGRQRLIRSECCPGQAVKAEFPFCFVLYNIRFGIFMKLFFLPKTFTYELSNGSVSLIY